MRPKSMFSLRAQMSMEYLVVIGFSMLLIAPMIVVFYQQSGELQEEISATQLQNVADELLFASEQVYFLGSPSQELLTLAFPPQIRSLDCTNNTIEVSYVLSDTIIHYYARSDIALNLNCSVSLTQGAHYIKVQALPNAVRIFEGS